jgi:hypothetical protein
MVREEIMQAGVRWVCEEQQFAWSKNGMPKSPCHSERERHGLLGILFLETNLKLLSYLCSFFLRSSCSCSFIGDAFSE